MCRRAPQEARARLAGVRRERGVGASDNPELRQHAETPVVVKATAVVAVAAVPTTAAVIAATMSELSRIITREERAEAARELGDIDVRGHLVAPCPRKQVYDSSMVALFAATSMACAPAIIG